MEAIRAAEPVDGLVCIPGKLFRPILHTQQLAEQPVDFRRLAERAVEEHIGDLGLLLHIVGERYIGGTDAADIDDQIRLELEDILQIGGAAAPCEPTVFRQFAHALQEESLFSRARRPHPTNHLLRCKRVEQDRCGWSGGKNARYPVGYF